MKKERYERAGIPSYWTVDPSDLRFTGYELRDGEYVVAADLSAEETWVAERPFPVTITPSQLRY